MAENNLPRCILFCEEHSDNPRGISMNVKCFDDLIEEVVKRIDHLPTSFVEKFNGFKKPSHIFRYDFAEIQFAGHINSAIASLVSHTWTTVLRKDGRKVVREIGKFHPSSTQQIRKLIKAAENIHSRGGSYRFAKISRQLEPGIKDDILQQIAEFVYGSVRRADEEWAASGLPYPIPIQWYWIFDSGIIIPNRDVNEEDLYSYLKSALNSVLEEYAKSGRPTDYWRDRAAATVVSTFCRMTTPWNAPKLNIPISPAKMPGSSERQGPVVDFMRTVERIYGISLISHNSGAAWSRINRLAAEKLRDYGAD